MNNNSSPEEGIAELLVNGQYQLLEDNLKEACDAFSHVLKYDPSHFDAIKYLGIIAYRTGMFESAVTFFSHAQAIRPDASELHGYMVKCRSFLDPQAGEKAIIDKVYGRGTEPTGRRASARLHRIDDQMHKSSLIDQRNSYSGKKSHPTFTLVVYSNNSENFGRLENSIKTALSDGIQIIRISDAKSCAEAYNRGAEASTGDIIIFCRDDVEILNSDLDRILAEDLSEADIVGAAGTSRLISGNWKSAGQPYVHGQLARRGKHSDDPPCVSVYGLGRDPGIVKNVQALDGVFFALKRDVISKIRFDEMILDDSGLAGLDFTFNAYLQELKVSVDHRLMVLANDNERHEEEPISGSNYFNNKYSKIIHDLDARKDKTLRQTGQKIVRCIKKTMVSSKTAAMNLMRRYGSGVRVNLIDGDGHLEEFENICIDAISLDTGMPFQENSVNYLRIHDVKFLGGDKYGWMREFYRVCGQGAVLEINMHWLRDMGEERKKLWQYHDFYCFDVDSPGYFKAAQKKGFDGVLALQSISTHANGPERRLTAIYQVVKNKKNIEWLRQRLTAQPLESVTGLRSIARIPKFSIIIPHYQGTIKHEHFLRGIHSILSQTLQDFEILCYHDGPLLYPDLEFPINIFPTAKRYDDWGHSLRNIGIHEAQGEYILHFNPDNLLYPGALERLSSGCRDILVYPVIMYGMERDGDLVFQHKLRDAATRMVLSGNPVVYGGIDCMQLVMRRKCWLEVGGWFDKRGNSDGFMYPLFAETYQVEFIGDKPLGEHW